MCKRSLHFPLGCSVVVTRSQTVGLFANPTGRSMGRCSYPRSLPVDTGEGPLFRGLGVAVFYRIVADVFRVVIKIPFVADSVFPEPPLP
jgi:hypothetical protein